MAAAKAKFTLSARADLAEIKCYSLEQWGPLQAKSYLHTIKQATELLAEQPRLGKARPDIKINAYSFPVKSHVIYYLAYPEYITVFAVLGESMLPKPHLETRLTN
ncbi:type II toxin-antitoxin system RelE/ParE family toxin [Alishewanella jeotgali]|uniref:Plasmid stabilization protein ParE, putative n=1 Tax=Alishewanella jeotgali KCTC 22429 TaxID=1129374 RepID=H3ZI17_9ALTE|nr:type II toxin-antitoxin system RelE/ParE family toxin [Alishewanella jeotgali]EHR39659.1 plasmid stabilization protein ParE, putative [Alishewanella jeotgali KCTC 22429]